MPRSQRLNWWTINPAAIRREALLSHARAFSVASQSNRNSAGSFFTLANFILDRLTFSELLDCRPFHLRVMKEQIAPFTFDEPKTLLWQYFFYLTIWHF
jgi:hypothetical protein